MKSCLRISDTTGSLNLGFTLAAQRNANLLYQLTAVFLFSCLLDAFPLKLVWFGVFFNPNSDQDFSD